MSAELINLVPNANTKSFRRLYFVHLAIVVILMLALLVGIQAILLIPSYLYERETVSSASARLAQVSESEASTQGAQVQNQLKSLQSAASYLQTLTTVPTASAAISAILRVPRPGVTLNGFTFTAPTKGAVSTLQVSGIATTRESLRNYDAALSALSFIKSADLPISDYAQESTIPFTISLAGTFTP